MVRFSDMLGGSGEPDDAAASASPYAELANEAGAPDDEEVDEDAEDAEPAATETVPMSTFETPEAVLDRLTQYATSARATEPAAPEPGEPEAVSEPEPEPEPEAEEPLTPVGDDFLPNARGIARRAGRGRKRHP